VNELVFDQVSVRTARVEILREVSLRVNAGDCVALVGPNGAGKTTLLRVALGLRKLTSGKVRISGTEVAQLSGRERAARLAWLPQHIHFSEPLSAEEVVATSRYRFSESHLTSLKKAHAALERVGSLAYATRAVTELSGGERQRVALAALLAQEAPLLVLDEPANHLDPAQQLEIYRLLGEMWREGKTLLTITHDINLISHMPNANDVRVVGIRAGTLGFDKRFDAHELPADLATIFGTRMRVLGSGLERVILPELAES
jgi:iron complex transport system ATP-binding protein